MAKAQYNGTGRRKSASARVRITPGSGLITINKIPADEYFENNQSLMWQLSQPFEVVSLSKKYDVEVLVNGGGINGQVDAITLGVSKALIEVNPELRSTLKRAGLLKRDSRVKERKKYGLKGARKKEQFSKR